MNENFSFIGHLDRAMKKLCNSLLGLGFLFFLFLDELGKHTFRLPHVETNEDDEMSEHQESCQCETAKSQNLPSALQNFDQLPNKAHVRDRVVAVIFACSTATVWRWAKSGRIPQPIRLSPRVSAWNVGQLRQALSLIDGSRKDAI